MKILISSCFLTFIGNSTFELDFGDNIKSIGITKIGGNSYFLLNSAGVPQKEGDYTLLSNFRECQ